MSGKSSEHAVYPVEFAEHGRIVKRRAACHHRTPSHSSLQLMANRQGVLPTSRPPEHPKLGDVEVVKKGHDIAVQPWHHPVSGKTISPTDPRPIGRHDAKPELGGVASCRLDITAACKATVTVEYRHSCHVAEQVVPDLSSAGEPKKMLPCCQNHFRSLGVLSSQLADTTDGYSKPW